MAKVRITADSTCDLSPELIQKYNIGIMPLLVGLGETYYLDGVNICPADIYKFVKEEKVLPKTAARSMTDYEEFFRSYTDQGESVVHFIISSEMSSSYQNACIAADEVGGDIHVIDSRNLSTGIALLMLDALEMADEGKSAGEIADAVRDRAKLVRASFVVDTLDYLRMGGRCSSVEALGANLLKLHPCIEVTNGVMGVAAKYRGPLSKVIIQYAKDKLKNIENIRPDHVFITHTDCDPAVVASVREEIEKTGHFKNIYETKAGCSVNSHCGQGTLGVLYEVNE